jgi:hypothetical protein
MIDSRGLIPQFTGSQAVFAVWLNQDALHHQIVVAACTSTAQQTTIPVPSVSTGKPIVSAP